MDGYDSTINSDFEVLSDENNDDEVLYRRPINTIDYSLTQSIQMNSFAEMLQASMCSTSTTAAAEELQPTMFANEATLPSDDSFRSQDSITVNQAATKNILLRTIGQLEEFAAEKTQLTEKISNLEAKVERLAKKNRNLQRLDTGSHRGSSLNAGMRGSDSLPIMKQTSKSVETTEQQTQTNEMTSSYLGTLLLLLLCAGLMVIGAALYNDLCESRLEVSTLHKKLDESERAIQLATQNLEAAHKECLDNEMEINAEDALDHYERRLASQNFLGRESRENLPDERSMRLIENIEKAGNDSRLLKEQVTLWRFFSNVLLASSIILFCTLIFVATR